MDAIIAALEVLLSSLPVEWALTLFFLIGISFFLKNSIEKRIGYAFNPKSRLREQLEELHKDIQFCEDPKIKKSLTYKRDKLLMEYHFELGKTLEVSKKWLEYSEAEGRKEGFTLAELAMAKLYLGIDPLTGKPKINLGVSQVTLLVVNFLGTGAFITIGSGLISAAIVLVSNGYGSWLGLLGILLSLPFWYGTWKSGDEILNFAYLWFSIPKRLERLLKEDKLLEQQEKQRLIEKDDVPSLKEDEGDKA